MRSLPHDYETAFCTELIQLDGLIVLFVINDLKFTLRQLRKSPGFTLVVVITLAKNSLLAKACDRLILESQLTPGLDTGLHRRALVNMIVHCSRTR